MNAFNKRTARRIGAVSLLLALLASPISWFVVRENVEQSTVSLAIEESQRLLGHFGAIALSGPGAATHADSAAKALAGGLFDIAEIYDGKGQRLAEAMTSNGLQVEGILLHHATPTYTSTRYESVKLPDQRWVLRVFVPLRLGGSPASEITGSAARWLQP